MRLVGGPGGASVAKGSRRKATTSRDATQERSRMRGWGPDRSQCTRREVPEEPQLPRARGARQQPRKTKQILSGLKNAWLGT